MRRGELRKAGHLGGSDWARGQWHPWGRRGRRGRRGRARRCEQRSPAEVAARDPHKPALAPPPPKVMVGDGERGAGGGGDSGGLFRGLVAGSISSLSDSRMVSRGGGRRRRRRGNLAGSGFRSPTQRWRRHHPRSPESESEAGRVEEEGELQV